MSDNLVILHAAGVDPYDPEATAPSELISFTSSFHGRTMGALALTYKQQYKTPFSPMIGGTHMVPWLDFDAVSQAVQKASLCCIPMLHVNLQAAECHAQKRAVSPSSMLMPVSTGP